MSVEYIVVQAGGKGTRMKRLTANKPKPLVPVRNLPILFHLFRAFPNAHFLVIGDYKFDVLERYLAAFADVEYSLIDARGKSGTCAGIKEALYQIPDDCAFMLSWGDVILDPNTDFPSETECRIGLSHDFPCRWKYENGVFAEEPSVEYGVAGIFCFPRKSLIEDVPDNGEFVAWLATKQIPFTPVPLHAAKEYGIYEEYQSLPNPKCRPFNRISIDGDVLVKEPVDAQGRELAEKEVAWYRKLENSGLVNLPRIYEYSPLKMSLVRGKNIYEYADIPLAQKQEILSQIVGCLQDIHASESVSSDANSYYDAYIGKTYSRLEKVQNLVPFAKDETVIVNGIECPNPFACRNEIEARMQRYFPERFELIHGDCTFSNIMLDTKGKPVLIDPRGYFGTTDFYGDPAYDWGKLYYSLVGDYDQFNLKRFELEIGSSSASISIETNGWKDLEKDFFALLENQVSVEQVKMIHAIIWLSLTTYAWEDYDTICGAFYQGALCLKEAL